MNSTAKINHLHETPFDELQRLEQERSDLLDDLKYSRDCNLEDVDELEYRVQEAEIRIKELGNIIEPATTNLLSSIGDAPFITCNSIQQ